MKIGIWRIKGWEKDYLESALKGHEVSFFEGDLNKDTIPSDTSFEIISVFVGSLLDSEVINALSNLKLITTRSTGFDHIDLETAHKKNIQVAYVPTYGENTVAEHAFALLLCLAHRIYEGYDRLREKGVYSFEGLEGFDLKDKTIGIIGTGHIGQYAIKIANGFSMKVIAFDAFPKKDLNNELNFEYKNILDELLSESDVVSLHVPYIKETHHMINKNNILKMKKGSVLINTARGALVETEALVSALEGGHLAGAGLDVFEEEDVAKDELGYLLSGSDKSDLKVVLENHKLIDMNNVIVTPHSAFNTKEAKTRILNTTLENINSFIEKGEAENLVKK
ncbi:MAG: hydroxyacid dehydrogenase [Candidatus Liptonbacteria bacterium CG11_big_fil_rev_8_21_14_0_20_35_14]|uniref:Hydroxyacid dehydrogenase n=1 Tax=Candidatus Liptonbacteria bacterium CG11_big_fil_rev_8_21_14_0_20_35_14 TaxID=1974634 RepID=A0A2H0N7L8_9BACT|nr:MAG: hydroxyacid dehydrogenase [Candidatus Liptonbacteria bacterium CG11_big_fil_rev_8_21_14_0_20_35_14]